MNPFITNYAKLYSQVEKKIMVIHNLSGLTLDDIIEKLAKGYEFVPPKQTSELMADLDNLTDEEFEALTARVNPITAEELKKVIGGDNE